MSKGNENKRTSVFQRNKNLETFLKEINSELWVVEQDLVKNQVQNYPLIFVVGPLRSGSTLMTQWLASLGLAYPTNLLSRFYQAPIMGAKLQLLLSDERYNFRDELKSFNSKIDFRSDNGKTEGVLAPNEFWYFWRRFLPFGELDYLSTNELFEKVDVELMKAEFAGMMNVFQKPMALKAMILNYNIDFLDKIFDNAIFIHTKRDPLANIESVLKARERQFGSIDQWYSFKIPEYHDLIKLNPYEQVAGQIYHINKALEAGLENVAEQKKITVQYEDLCQKPGLVFNELKQKLAANGYEIEHKYNLQENFDITRKQVTNENILKAWEKFVM